MRQETDVWTFLDMNPQYHKLCGEDLQEQYDRILIGTDDTFYDASGHSWRGWGALMADYMNEREHTDKYDYMDFYMEVDYDRLEGLWTIKSNNETD